MQIEVNGAHLWFDVDGAALVLQSTMARFDLDRLVERFRQVGGDEVAATVERVYGATACR
jgi:hypothetical protein